MSWMSTKRATLLATALGGFAILSGCQTLTQAGQQVLGPAATQALTRGMSTVDYTGQVWSMPYSISRAPDGSYFLSKLPGGGLTPVGQFLSMKKIYSHQAAHFGIDVFATPTQSCPSRYLMVSAASNNGGHFTMMGCEEPLTFQAGRDGNVYATQAAPAGVEPLAYRITANNVSSPSPVSQLAGYPQSARGALPRVGTNRAVAGATANGYAGHVWNVDYTVTRLWGGEYMFHKRDGRRSYPMGHFESLRMFYSTQTKTFAMDIFEAPTSSCPHQYLMVLASGNESVVLKTIGCMQPLTFQAGATGQVYATQPSVGGATPLAYTIGARGYLAPEPITQLAGYPQGRPTYHASRATSYRAHADAGLGPVPVPEQAPTLPAPTTADQPMNASPVTVDLGGSSSR